MRRITHEEYLALLQEKQIEIIPLEKFINATTPIKHKCLKHGIEWGISPSNVLHGKGCKECAREKQGDARRKSIEEYASDLVRRGAKVIPLGGYVNGNTPILHKCLVHNIEWEAKPKDVLKSKGCPLCTKEKREMAKRKTNEEYLNELELKGIEIKPIEKYRGMNTPILHHCPKHNIDWKALPANVLNGKGCQLCRGEKIKNAKLKPEEKYIKELAQKNPNIVLVGKYDGARKHTMHRCLIHDYEWMVVPHEVLSGCGCPICGREKSTASNKFTHEQYLAMLKEKNSDIVPVDEYIAEVVPILHHCLKHNVDWVTTPVCVLQGCGCPMCKKEKHRATSMKTDEQYRNDLYKVNPNIIPLEEYNGSNTPILHLCTEHNVKWKALPSNLLAGHGCRKCRESHGEESIMAWLDSHHIKYEAQKTFADCIDKRALPFDIYIPSMNAIIEYDGKQHYEPIKWFGGEDGFNVLKRHDEIKTNYCLQNGIKLLRIPYYKNVEKELDSFIYNS